MVVEVHPLPDPGSDLRQRAVAPETQLLVFQTPPEPLDKNVVNPAPLAVHAGASSAGLHRLNPCLPRERASPVGADRRETASRRLPGGRSEATAIDDVGSAVRDCDGIPGGLDAEAGVHRREHPPRKHRPRVPIHDRHQADVPLIHRDVGTGA